MKIIELSQGKQTIVDDEDYEWLNAVKWCYDSGYAARRICLGNKKLKNVKMHREIINAPSNLCVDHINRNPLDNRRANLRLATKGDNARNAKKRKDSRNKYKGVFPVAPVGWKVVIAGEYFGYFLDEGVAARVYNEAVKLKFGEFAVLNVIE